MLADEDATRHIEMIAKDILLLIILPIYLTLTFCGGAGTVVSEAEPARTS